MVIIMPVSASDKQKATLLVFGDSLSAAYGIDYDKGWVSLLQVNMPEWHIVNASVSGETTQGGLARLPALLKEHQPNIVVLELGANDGLRAYPTQLMYNNLKQMIEQVHAIDAQVVLLGMQMPPNYGRRYTEDFAAVYSRLADEFQLPLLPFFLQEVALNSDLLLSDNLHPNEEAQPILLNNVWSVLSPLLSKQPLQKDL